MVRTHVRWPRVVVLAVGLVGAVSAGAGWAGAGPQGPPPVQAGRTGERTYIVESGDTLWRIAARLVGPREDPRPMVARLLELNRIQSGVIVPGQRLTVP